MWPSFLMAVWASLDPCLHDFFSLLVCHRLIVPSLEKISHVIWAAPPPCLHGSCPLLHVTDSAVQSLLTLLQQGEAMLGHPQQGGFWSYRPVTMCLLWPLSWLNIACLFNPVPFCSYSCTDSQRVIVQLLWHCTGLSAP